MGYNLRARKPAKRRAKQDLLEVEHRDPKVAKCQKHLKKGECAFIPNEIYNDIFPFIKREILECQIRPVCQTFSNTVSRMSHPYHRVEVLKIQTELEDEEDDEIEVRLSPLEIYYYSEEDLLRFLPILRAQQVTIIWQRKDIAPLNRFKPLLNKCSSQISLELNVESDLSESVIRDFNAKDFTFRFFGDPKTTPLKLFSIESVKKCSTLTVSGIRLGQAEHFDTNDVVAWLNAPLHAKLFGGERQFCLSTPPEKRKNLKCDVNAYGNAFICDITHALITAFKNSTVKTPYQLGIEGIAMPLTIQDYDTYEENTVTKEELHAAYYDYGSHDMALIIKRGPVI